MINKNNTLVILDWDNTLFPTTWFIQKINSYSGQSNYNDYNNQNNIDINLDINLDDLDSTLYNLLINIQKVANIVIITNAMTQWIISSSATLPKTKKILETIEIISAKEKYMHSHNNITDWKKMAFHHTTIIKPHIINVISVGDAFYEYNALISLYNKDNKMLLKSIKFLDEPHHETLLDQLNVLNKVIHPVCASNKHLDLIFRSKQNFIKKNNY